MQPFCNLQKITIFFRTAKPTLAESLKFPWHGFYKIAALREKQRRQAKMEGTEIVSSNNKERIKGEICGRTVFLFWLHLDSQSLRNVRKFCLPRSVIL